ncbi:MAG: hypothetical protein ACHQHO_09455 [Solirubrobacterales bacterium]
MATTSTKIDTVAKERLPWLCNSVQSEYSLVATQEDVVSALVLGTPVAQLAGLLLSYHRTTSANPGKDPTA